MLDARTFIYHILSEIFAYEHNRISTHPVYRLQIEYIKVALEIRLHILIICKFIGVLVYNTIIC